MIKLGFIGEYEHSLDDKGRVMIPKHYKHYIENTIENPEARNIVVLRKGANKNIEVFTAEDWSRMVEEYTKTTTLLNDNSKTEKIAEMARNAHYAKVDKTGRILIPQKLKEYAGIKKKVIFSGAIDRFLIWAEEEYKSKINKK